MNFVFFLRSSAQFCGIVFELIEQFYDFDGILVIPHRIKINKFRKGGDQGRQKMEDGFLSMRRSKGKVQITRTRTHQMFVAN